MKILIKNIKSLLGVHETPPQFLSGKDMRNLPAIDNAWLAIENKVIVGYGEMNDWPGISDWRDLEVIDATGKYVLPTWCDSHTHLVYAGNRIGEFVDRIHGLSYEEIAARGGGILNSADRLEKCSEDELFENAMKRLDDIMAMGTGAVEIKSGYGLNTESELKMLRVIHRLNANHPLTIKATFLGAHAYPREFKDNHQGYIDLLVNEMIPEVGRQQLASFIDVFCEKNYFSVEDTDRILEAGAKYGLVPKTHVNQFNVIGGVDISVKHKALSVDHLEVISEEDIAILKGSPTMPVALPGCSLFIKIPYTPARQIIDAGLPLALATDFNPGSTPSGNMNLVNSLACIQMNMLPEEVINASTINGAYAMGLHRTHGTISVDKKASVILTKEIHSPAELMYSFGTNNIDRVLI
ncbi:MAG: imidazolonepropionase [Flavobacteriales bacterium]|nr:imidazolonepropionase [Flavobacteriales bacterium]